MLRVCEPELMDGAEQARQYADGDFSATDQAVIDRIAFLFPAGLGERVVDLGCGPGNISFRLASRHPTSVVLGLDGAQAMLAIAEAKLRSEPAWPNLSFQLARLPCPDLPVACFSTVVSNSLLHHLHDPMVLWKTVRQLGATGAAVYVKDLRRPDSEAAVQALLAAHLAGAPPLLERDYLHSLRAAFTQEEVQEQLEQAGLSGLEVRALEDRYLEIAGRLV
ncbi:MULTISPECIES: class I SAM-dependent methyltransferase [Synechococcales]|uniref:class I SAM-dependent methyltransferase n=1 Tax=Synechococcus sp. CS-1324 TaxID=2847980 RepID=UPI00223AF755|nr:class I SAM-dependent methyltransferase [Synechococcus sp. CS-1324]